MNNSRCCLSCLRGNLSGFANSIFKDVVNIIEQNGIPYTCDDTNIMICSPVGNQIKYTQKKADILLTGYCTAPRSAIQYIKEYNLHDKNLECKHSFNTPNMRSGIQKILTSIGFKNSQEIFNTAIDLYNYNQEINFVFTQMLCMISRNASSKAKDVEWVLKNKVEKFLAQANSSLTAWYKRILLCLKENGIILVMGHEAMNLLNKSFILNNVISICFKTKYCSGESLLKVLTKKYNVFYVIHASAINRPNLFKKWMRSPKRFELNMYLKKMYPDNINDEISKIS